MVCLRGEDWYYRLSRFLGRVSSFLYLLLTSCIFLIARGCVLFVRLGDWAGISQGEVIRINSTKPSKYVYAILRRPSVVFNISKENDFIFFAQPLILKYCG